MGQVGNWVFIAFFFYCPRVESLSAASRHFLGWGSVSLATYHLLELLAVHPLSFLSQGLP
jgi:hypothetical protein